jgi:hypothetical protein
MLLSVGEPLTACVTEDEREFDALSPYTRRTIPTARNAIEGILVMGFGVRGLDFTRLLGLKDNVSPS